MDEAVKIFKLNIDRHPNSWNCYDSYAEALALSGEKNKAKKYYKKALELAPENQKDRIRKEIE